MAKLKCDQCASAVSWQLTIKDKRGDAVLKLRVVQLCGSHAKPLRDRPKTSAYEVTKSKRITQKGYYTK